LTMYLSHREFDIFRFRFTTSKISCKLLLDQRKTKGKCLLLYRYRKCLFLNIHEDRERGWRSGMSTRLFPMCPCSIPARCHMWAEFVVNSYIFPRFFTVLSDFPPSSKTNILNCMRIRSEDRHESQLTLMSLRL